MGFVYYYSDDHGVSWKRGHDFGIGTNEFMACELEDGDVIALLRSNRDSSLNDGYVKISYSYNGGGTSSEIESAQGFPTPICEVSVIRLNSYNRERYVIAGHPLSIDSRTEFGLRISLDEGRTRNKSLLIYKGPSAYSDPAFYNSSLIGVFERGQVMYQEKISFFSISLEHLT